MGARCSMSWTPRSPSYRELRSWPALCRECYCRSNPGVYICIYCTYVCMHRYAKVCLKVYFSCIKTSKICVLFGSHYFSCMVCTSSIFMYVCMYVQHEERLLSGDCGWLLRPGDGVVEPTRLLSLGPFHCRGGFSATAHRCMYVWQVFWNTTSVCVFLRKKVCLTFSNQC